MSVGFRFVPAKKDKIEQAFSKALFACQEQIVTDCNYYARKDTGVMIQTSRIQGVSPIYNSQTSHVDKMTLKVIWDTPYAKRVYYTGTPRTDKNAQASLMWAEKAAKRWRNDWRRILQKGLQEQK